MSPVSIFTTLDIGGRWWGEPCVQRSAIPMTLSASSLSNSSTLGSKMPMFDRPAIVSNATTPKAEMSAFSVRRPLMAYSGARQAGAIRSGFTSTSITRAKGEKHLQCASNFRADMSLLLIKQLCKPKIRYLGGKLSVK
ncbi:hypothetical protein U9M48_040450 [Paspalum notatum var. saurae]|uniref:Uncharacterized protein n=1 Tax=Paspalum notatum var. saurae TaxID=547442 RepID=A0AAQ3XE74_PASNO